MSGQSTDAMRTMFEKFLPAGSAQENAIFKGLGLDVDWKKGSQPSATPKPPAQVNVFKPAATSAAPTAKPSSTANSQARTRKHSATWKQDHAPLPASRLKPLRHPGIWDLQDPHQVHTIIADELDRQKFTYIIVGGGTAGLVLAKRLTEDPENKVLVIEAGPFKSNNPYIDTPNLESKLWGSELDWCYRTVPQVELNGRQVTYPRGRLVGGCSNFNIAVMNRAPKIDFDAWEKLGNPGWNWDALLEYHKQSESFHIPTPAKNADPRTGHDPIWKPAVHGHDGPVQTSYSPYVSEQFAGLFDALRDEGLKEIDPSAGKPYGVGYLPSSVNPETNIRCSSEAAYLFPSRFRENLMLGLGGEQLQKAVGVAFVDVRIPEENFVARCMDEVILCGGSFNSPQLLELSGVGDSMWLEKLNINTVVDLPGVGENLQDHPAVTLSFKLKDGLESLDLLNAAHRDFTTAAFKDYKRGLGPLTQGCPVISYFPPKLLFSSTEQAQAEDLLRVKKDVRGERHEIAADRGRRKMLKIEQENYPKRAIVEVIAMNKFLGGTKYKKGDCYIGMIIALQHALSRGSVHIKSTNPLEKPAVDPRYLSHPADAFHLALGTRFVYRMCMGPDGAMADYIDQEHVESVGFSGIDLRNGEEGDEAQWDAFVRKHVATEHHPAGTCSMLPRADGGVVDPTLKVYGTANVRVADCSIIPLHIATHTQSTAYMIGEKASDLVIEAQLQRRKGW